MSVQLWAGSAAAVGAANIAVTATAEAAVNTRSRRRMMWSFPVPAPVRDARTSPMLPSDWSHSNRPRGAGPPVGLDG
jgi:hypothetical protein